MSCKGKTKCVLCEEVGKPHNHRLGGPRCLAPPSKGITGVFRRSPTRSPARNIATEEIMQETQTTKHVEDPEEMETNQPPADEIAEPMDAEAMENSIESDLI